MRARLIVAAGLAVLAVAGCSNSATPWRRPARPAYLELKTEQGTWRVEAFAIATLERDGWQIRLTESKVATGGATPMLETLAFVVTNTDRTRPLLLEPEAVLLIGVNRVYDLGPRDTYRLMPGESVRLGWWEGLRAPLLPYPFRLDLTVFRGENFTSPDKISLRVY